MAADPFFTNNESSGEAEVVTPSDTIGLGRCARGLIITVAGTVSLVGPKGVAVTLPAAMAVGVIHSIRFTRINASGTTATGLIAVF